MVVKAILAVVCLVSLIGVWALFGKRKIGIASAWGWSGLWAAGLALVLFPDISSAVAAAVGVGRGVDFVVYLSVLLAFYLIFRIFVRLDRIERDITEIVRREALDRAAGPETDRHRP